MKTWLMRKGIRNIVLFLGLAFFSAWTLFPFLWIISTSIKPDRDLYRRVSLWPKTITDAHYIEVLFQTPFLTYFKNSFMVATLTTVIAMAVAVLAAYAMTRLSFTGRGFIARATIVTYLIPAALLFIPLFQIAQQFAVSGRGAGPGGDLFDIRGPLLDLVGDLLLQHIPTDLEDAALVEWATRLRSLFTILLPLGCPRLRSSGLLLYAAWDEFFSPCSHLRESQKRAQSVGEILVGHVSLGAFMAGL